MYIVTDSSSRVIEIYERHSEGTIAVDWNPEENLMDERCVYRYKFVDGEVFERTAEEMDADYASMPKQPPSAEELLAALADGMNGI